MADDESEYQKSPEEIEQEKRAEQERQMEENYEYNNQPVYEEEPSWEERFHTYDAYKYGGTQNMYYQDSYGKDKNQ